MSYLRDISLYKLSEITKIAREKYSQISNQGLTVQRANYLIDATFEHPEMPCTLGSKLNYGQT